MSKRISLVEVPDNQVIEKVDFTLKPMVIVEIVVEFDPPLNAKGQKVIVRVKPCSSET